VTNTFTSQPLSAEGLREEGSSPPSLGGLLTRASRIALTGCLYSTAAANPIGASKDDAKLQTSPLPGHRQFYVDPLFKDDGMHSAVRCSCRQLSII
jgi:hypothetical protein